MYDLIFGLRAYLHQRSVGSNLRFFGSSALNQNLESKYSYFLFFLYNFTKDSIRSSSARNAFALPFSVPSSYDKTMFNVTYISSIRVHKGCIEKT